MKVFFLLVIFFFFKVTFLLPAKDHWEKVTIGSNGYVFYINLLSIEEKGSKIYFWQLIDYLNPDEYGDMSAKIYIESDCVNLKYKWISFSYHKMSMGKDTTELKKPTKDLSRWQTALPNSTSKSILDYVCNSTGITL